MSEISWEKSIENSRSITVSQNRRWFYLLVGVALLSAVVYLVATGTLTGSYYKTVDELVSDSSLIGKDVRVGGAVDGDTIEFDPNTQILSFTIVNIPNDGDAIEEAGGLANVLHAALEDGTGTRLQVVWENAEMPDLMQHEAQAIVNGEMGADGIFYADQVLLKCPTRYSDEVPSQIVETN